MWGGGGGGYRNSGTYDFCMLTRFSEEDERGEDKGWWVGTVCNDYFLVGMVVFTRSLELKNKEVMRRRSKGGLCTVMVHMICFVYAVL